jgi:hypothetical protein
MNRFALFVLAVASVTLAACTEFEVKNKPPTAVALAIVGGAPADLTKPIDYPGSPLAVVLDGRSSKDVDGSIKRYLWLRTDVGPSTRYAGNGMVDAGGAAHTWAIRAAAQTPP